MIQRIIYTYTIFSLLFVSALNAQVGVKKASNLYDNLSYSDAANVYEKVNFKKLEGLGSYKQMANSFYKNAKYKKANKYYEMLFAKADTTEVEAEYYFKFSQTLKHVGNDSLSLVYLEKYKEKTAGTTQISKNLNDYSKLVAEINTNSGRYQDVKNFALNTPFADFGSYVHNNSLYFTSARDTGSLTKKIHSWTNAAFTKIYSYKLDGEGEKNRLKKELRQLKKQFNQSTAILTADGNTMYFTSNHVANKRNKSKSNIFLKLYKAEKIDNKWQNIVELPFNIDGFNTAHPALSNDEKNLYFVSDRPGGFGSSDIWKVEIHDGVFGAPINLGPTVNTEARETFPFINKNNELYFSSDGRLSLGGLDVFAVKLYEGSKLGKVQNIGEPINSLADDFAYFINFDTKLGFFSSNREGGIGNDDIYSFLETKMLQLHRVQNIKVLLVDNLSKEIIPDAKISVYNKDNQLLETITLNDNNDYVFNMEFECEEDYLIKIEKEGYILKDQKIKTSDFVGEVAITIELEAEDVKPDTKEHLKVFDLKPIYFDFDKSYIRKDAALELAKVVQVLKDNPNIKIEVRSHTDSRGADSYNLKLSQRRAKATAEWIIKKGIDLSRVTYRGYGEKHLLNKCKNGVKCSRSQHEINRRSEFIILEN